MFICVCLENRAILKVKITQWRLAWLAYKACKMVLSLGSMSCCCYRRSYRKGWTELDWNVGRTGDLAANCAKTWRAHEIG